MDKILQGKKELTDQVNNTAGVTPLVIVPRNQLDEVVVEGNTGGGIEDGGVGVSVQISGDESILGVGEDSWIQQLGRSSQKQQGTTIQHIPLSSFSEAFLMVSLIWS